MGRFALILSATALTACAAIKEEATEVRRNYAEFNADFLGRAFVEGPVSVVADRHGELAAFTLVRCGGHHVCLDNAHGRQGHVEQRGTAQVVRGIHRGHTYYLFPGGTGYVIDHRGDNVPLAWD